MHRNPDPMEFDDVAGFAEEKCEGDWEEHVHTVGRAQCQPEKQSQRHPQKDMPRQQTSKAVMGRILGSGDMNLQFASHSTAIIAEKASDSHALREGFHGVDDEKAEVAEPKDGLRLPSPRGPAARAGC